MSAKSANTGATLATNSVASAVLLANHSAPLAIPPAISAIGCLDDQAISPITPAIVPTVLVVAVAAVPAA